MNASIQKERTVLITGSSSGFGLRTSVTLARRGWRVLATMRDLGRREVLEEAARAAGVLERIEILPLDVTSADQIAAIVAEIESRKIVLDAIVNNAGFAIAGFADDVSDEELRRQFDTNFFAAAAVTRGFLPLLRRQGHGRIVMLASIAGKISYPGISSYNASKHALEGWSEALRHELRPLGIWVSLVEPGSFETDIWSRNAAISAGSLDPDSPNARRLECWRTRLRKSKKRADPQVVADGIARILESRRPPMRRIFGRDAKAASVLEALLPWGLWERLVTKAAGLD